MSQQFNRVFTIVEILSNILQHCNLREKVIIRSIFRSSDYPVKYSREVERYMTFESYIEERNAMFKKAIDKYKSTSNIFICGDIASEYYDTIVSNSSFSRRFDRHRSFALCILPEEIHLIYQLESSKNIEIIRFNEDNTSKCKLIVESNRVMSIHYLENDSFIPYNDETVLRLDKPIQNIENIGYRIDASFNQVITHSLRLHVSSRGLNMEHMISIMRQYDPIDVHCICVKEYWNGQTISSFLCIDSDTYIIN